MGTENQTKNGIRALRGTLWATQKELAKKAGIDQSQMSRFLRKKNSTTILSSNVFKLLDALNARITFPGDKNDQATGCLTPEAAHIDRWISKMRAGEKPADESAICAFVLKELEAQFSKSTPHTSEERKLAS